MPSHIELRRRDYFGERISLIELLSLLHLGHQLRGHWRSGLVMFRVMIEDRRIAGPVLVELRWEFHEIACHLRSRKARILRGGKHAVQRVSELVEHRAHVAEAEQSRLARSRLGEVGHVVDNRQSTEQLGLVYKNVHPGAAIFVVALEIVAIEERQLFSVCVENIKDAYIWMVDRKVVPLFERDPVKLMGGVEDAVLEHAVEFKIRLNLVFVQIVLGLS